MKSFKQFTREIDSLTEKRTNRQAIDELVKIKRPAVRARFDSSFIDFWKDGSEDSICNIELNKKESEILRRFLYNLKKRSL